jgi:hypothetical protein
MAVLVATSAVRSVKQGLAFFWGLTWRPVVFFQGHVGRPPSWYQALAGPLVCSCLTVLGYIGFTSHITPLVAMALSASNVPASFVTSMQYMSVIGAASVCVVVWLVASAVMLAVEVLRADSVAAVRVLELNALAFYSQVPWLLAFVYVAWTYRSPLDAVGAEETPAAGPGIGCREKHRRVLHPVASWSFRGGVSSTGRRSAGPSPIAGPGDLWSPACGP